MPSRENSPWPFKARPATVSQGKPALSRIRVATALGLVIKVTAGPVARLKLPGHRQAREQVAAGAPGGDDDFKFRVSSFEFLRQSCIEKIDLTQRRQGARKAQAYEDGGRDARPTIMGWRHLPQGRQEFLRLRHAQEQRVALPGGQVNHPPLVRHEDQGLVAVAQLEPAAAVTRQTGAVGPPHRAVIRVFGQVHRPGLFP